MNTLPLHVRDGYILVELGGALWLVGTGAPTSFGTASGLSFAGVQSELSARSQMMASLRRLYPSQFGAGEAFMGNARRGELAVTRGWTTTVEHFDGFEVGTRSAMGSPPERPVNTVE